MERRPPAEGRPTGDCTTEEGVGLEEMVDCTVCATLDIRIEITYGERKRDRSYD